MPEVLVTRHAERWPGRLILMRGAAAGSVVFGLVIIGVVAEARQSWRNGVAAFFADAGIRLGFGACIAVLTAAPYILVARASRLAGPPMVFAMAGVAMIAFQLWFMADMLFFARSSTASLGFLFMPLYLGIPAVAIWMAAVLARRFRSSPRSG